jgi:hypothetical protein
MSITFMHNFHRGANNPTIASEFPRIFKDRQRGTGHFEDEVLIPILQPYLQLS